MIGTVRTSSTDIYEAVLALSRSIAGHTDLESLLSGVGRALRRVVNFDYLGMMLPEREGNRMRLHVLSAAGPVETHDFPTFSVEQDPAGWVWLNQQPLVIRSIEDETRWPEYLNRVREAGLHSLALVPLTVGDNRLGVFGFGCLAPFDPSPVELEFLERVASEFAVAVDAYLTKQQLILERDRARALCDITNTLVSKLSWDELLAAISTVLSKVLPHAGAAIAVLDKTTGRFVLHAVHVTDNIWFDIDRTPVPLEDLPFANALIAGEPVIATNREFEHLPGKIRTLMVERGLKAICAIPLKTSSGLIGMLSLGRITEEPFTAAQAELAVQVARQIAIALENSLMFRELAEAKEKLALEKLYLEEEIRVDQNLGNMVGESPAFQALLKTIQIVAPTDATVLIEGETGSGKELVARAIHEASSRKGRSFVKVNCAAIPATLLESELFGHEKGAFTGAVSQKIGRFELADGGTLFLDEVGEIPLELQPKLLRAIQEQEFERLGSNRTIHVDVRIIAATNRDLKRLVEESKFRSDLYYRLHVFPIHVPPLRERREDIPLLVRSFTQKFAQRMNRRIESIPTMVMEQLVRYDWPGNIRELQNLIERSVILTSGSVLTVPLLELQGKTAAAPHARGPEANWAAERERILKALKEAKGVVGGPHGAAARLGLKRTTLQSRMRKYQISRQYR